MNALGTTVCVTGASGYIASWLVKFLLQRGYTVKASVRNLNDRKKTEHLLALDGAKDRLHLFKANLLEEGSFDAVVAGCEGVFHTASPFTYAITDPQAELIDPALKGTLNVLGSCAKAPSVKRVVLTSSTAAVIYSGRPLTSDVVVDETWFSNAEICKEKKLWYVLSKTLAEDAAWKFVKEKGIDMVTINPAMVIGPLLQPTLNTSVAAVLNIINGAQTYPNFSFGWVNVKDVANAHILAFEIPSASGRYCLVETVAHYSEIVDILEKLYPSFQLPDNNHGFLNLLEHSTTNPMGTRYPLAPGTPTPTTRAVHQERANPGISLCGTSWSWQGLIMCHLAYYGGADAIKPTPGFHSFGTNSFCLTTSLLEDST